MERNWDFLLKEIYCCFYSYNACLPPAQHCVWDPELSLYNGYIRFCLSKQLYGGMGIAFK